jgi:large subunit ribosomal protein L4
MQVPVYNQKGEHIETMDVSNGVFGLKWNADLVHQVVVGQRANKRAGTAHAKTRGEVRGGGKKPWRQKGTGRARHGSNRSPIWSGGGVTHGPRSDKQYTKKINRKMARKALYTVLSAKLRDSEMIVIDAMDFPEGKTKHAGMMFDALKKQDRLKRITAKNGVLIAFSSTDAMMRRALRNLPYAIVRDARSINACEVSGYKYVVFPKDAMTIFNT